MLDHKFDIYRNEWLELVFADRNHAYGAYVLRKNYGKTLAKALFCSSAVFISLILLLTLKVSDGGKAVDTSAPKPIPERIFKISMPEMPSKRREIPPAASENKTPDKTETSGKAQTKRFVIPKIVASTQEVEEMPSIEDLAEAVIGQVNLKGGKTEGNSLPAGNTGTKGGVSGAEGAGDNVYTFDLIEKYPEFPGGMEAFAKFLQKNLHYPSLALENGISGRVTISFIVEKDGRLTDIRILKGIGFGCDEEAVRVLKKSPLWVPGVQNRQKVRVQYVVPVVFRTE